jgi:hypothetical protein
VTVAVAVPPGREVERRYVLDVVLGEWLGLDWRLVVDDRPDVRITLDGAAGAVTLPDGLLGTADADWLTPAALPRAPLPRVPVGPGGAGPLGADEELPVLYGHRPGRPTLVEGGAEPRVNVDVLGSAFFMLTRYEELLDGPRDRHDRFPAAASVAARGAFLDVPVVDALVELLWVAMQQTWPRLRRRESRYAVLLTHDVDDPLSTLGRSPALLARQLAGDLVHRRAPRLAARRARAALAARRGAHDRDPNNTFDFLMGVSERHGLRSAFYFLADTVVAPGAPAVHVLDHPWVRGLVGHVHRRGHEVGLHAGFGTYRDPERTRDELAALRVLAAEQGVQQDRWGGRQHYLQWSNPQTWRNWDEAGLDYDCTLAYGDAVGFRTGTAREFGVFDVPARRRLALRERPFQVMDVTLFGYLGLAPDAARDAVLAIAGECRRFGGTFGLLWHNDEVLRTDREKRWYAGLVAELAAG